MVTWVCNQLGKGKRVHVGCIGGHGRTGLFIAAVRAEYNGDKNATTWTRQNHCVNAVETQTQIDFLFKHYKVKKLAPSKKNYKGWVEKQSTYSSTRKQRHNRPVAKGKNVLAFNRLQDSVPMKHLSGKGSIWG